jgi:CDP-glucose 4,6-dehydratase
MPPLFHNIFQDQRLLVTGHTGFKGSWLSLWLSELGAQVIGYSLEPPTQPNNFTACRLSERLTDLRGDVRHLEHLQEVFELHAPQVVFHLAAQPLVRQSYAQPVETFAANLMGTVNLLEAARRCPSVRAVVCITSDKCYENREQEQGYVETDRLGGRDPYSASKAMAELAVTAYRQSFFSSAESARVASARAGNVIGGGDWGKDRLVPDCVRALAEGRAAGIRNPASRRPWQFVLEPLSGYLWLAARLLEGEASLAEAWNFGPPEGNPVSVGELAGKLVDLWGAGSLEILSQTQAPHEAGLLSLSWEKAARRLAWQPVYNWQTALAETVRWYRTYYDSAEHDLYGTCVEQIQAYTERAGALGLAWTR